MLKRRSGGARFNTEAISKLFSVDKSVFAAGAGANSASASASGGGLPSSLRANIKRHTHHASNVATAGVSSAAAIRKAAADGPVAGPAAGASASKSTTGDDADEVDVDEPLSSTFSVGKRQRCMRARVHVHVRTCVRVCVCAVCVCVCACA